MVSFKGIDPITGLLLLIFVGAPYYYLTIPLWLALYPVAGSATVLVYIGAFMYFAGDSLITDSGHFAFPFFLAVVAAWPLTLVDQAYSLSHPFYRRLRHVVRIGLIGLWAIYALSERCHIRQSCSHEESATAAVAVDVEEHRARNLRHGRDASVALPKGRMAQHLEPPTRPDRIPGSPLSAS